MLEYQPLKVLRWRRYQPPVNIPGDTPAKPDMFFEAQLLIDSDREGVKPIGLHYTWEFRIKTTKTILLVYAAQQELILSGDYIANEEKIWQTVETSYSFYRQEFENRKNEADLAVVLPPLKKDEINLPYIIKLLHPG